MIAVAEAVKLALVREPTPYRELVIGKNHIKQLGRTGHSSYQNPTYADQWKVMPDFPADTFDEIHAYFILHQLGAAGDFTQFFDMFSRIWKMLKPDGHLYATVPSPCSDWLWGDPGNVRAITPASISFLQQPLYVKNVGCTSMTDYRYLYRADFEPELMQDDSRELRLILRAIKPARCLT